VQPVQIGEDFVVPVRQLTAVPGVSGGTEQGILDEHESLGSREVAKNVAEGEGVLLMAPLEPSAWNTGGDQEGAFPDPLVIGEEGFCFADFHEFRPTKAMAGS
jgi:hypothetical protein